MKGLQTLGIILSFCGFALCEPTCDYKTIEEKYVCLMSDSSSDSSIKDNHSGGKVDDNVHRVTTTDVASKNLINKVLTKYTKLNIFQIPKGKIDTIEVADFEKCTDNLIELQICNGDFSSIPNTTFDKCTKLESIDFTGNKLSLAEIGSFPAETKKLILTNNQIKMEKTQSTIFNDSLNLKNLEHLDLSINSINSLSETILPSIKLIHLDLSHNKLENIPSAFFDNNPDLEVLNLQNNQIVSFPQTILKDLTKLKQLNVGSNNISTIDANAFQENKLIEFLDMSSNPILTLNVNLLKNLTTLKTLNLHDIKLTSSSLEPLKTTLLALTNLEKLDISKNVIGPIDGLFTKNDKLTELNIGSMELSEFKGDIFSALTKLQSLTFDDNKIAELPENVFEKTTEMKELSAKGNKLTKLKASTFEKMTSLTTLDFTGNEIEAIERTFFDKLTKLTVVKFGDKNKCIKTDFDDFKLDDEMRVKFHDCFENYNSARTVVISNVLLAFVVILKFI